MKNEMFKIFDDNKIEIGVASRSDVHRYGYWHETFHCWFVTKHHNTDYLYLQLRSHSKADYPNLLDITAAGHLTADETASDGVREIKEEVGIDVPFNDLEELGIIEYSVIREDFIDKELANVFLYKCNFELDSFTVQADEVSGMVMISFEQFCELWLGEKDTIEVSGFKLDKDGNRGLFVENVGRDKFVPHQLAFYKEVIQRIKEKL